jgi:hypothetical protein
VENVNEEHNRAGERIFASGFAPNDNLVMILAKSIIEPPVNEEHDVLGCSVLLNLVDPFNGVKIIEQELKKRECYQEIRSLMNIGMLYSSLNNSKECSTAEQRRNLLLHKFHEKFTLVDSGRCTKSNRVNAALNSIVTVLPVNTCQAKYSTV